MSLVVRLTLLSAAIFLLLSYGGIRSPDSDVVFLTTQVLAENGSFAHQEGFVWQHFGLHKGVDGQYYSLFGPAESIAAIPLYKLAQLLNQTEWYQHFPWLVGTSFYASDKAVFDFMAGEPPPLIEQHALRTITSLFNVIISALCVGLFYLTARLLSHSAPAALLTSVLLAFGTMLLPYSGTFFSEPMASLFVLLSLYLLIRIQNDSTSQHKWFMLGSGLALGMAIATHISTILFTPFFFVYALLIQRQLTPTELRPLISHTGLFCVGVTLFLLLLGYHNYSHFGHPLETGRTVSSEMVYATFVAPWQGLWALLISSAKGLFVYSPIVLLAILLWRPFHRRYPLLSTMLIAAMLFRLLFIATRSDWHGGFCLGPRHLFVLLPLLLLPLSIVVAEWLEKRKIKHLIALGAFSFICIAQQLYFTLGEVISFTHRIKRLAELRGVNVFQDNAIYLNWDLSPALYLLDFNRAPLLLRNLDINNYLLWGIMLAITAIALTLLYLRLLKHHKP